MAIPFGRRRAVQLAAEWGLWGSTIAQIAGIGLVWDAPLAAANLTWRLMLGVVTLTCWALLVTGRAQTARRYVWYILLCLHGVALNVGLLEQQPTGRTAVNLALSLAFLLYWLGRWRSALPA